MHGILTYITVFQRFMVLVHRKALLT